MLRAEVGTFAQIRMLRHGNFKIKRAVVSRDDAVRRVA